MYSRCTAVCVCIYRCKAKSVRAKLKKKLIGKLKEKGWEWHCLSN